MLSRLGHLFFRTRNGLFPLLLVIVCGVFLPVPLDRAGAPWLIGGLLVLLAGQGLRVVTIGLDYIQRGGRDGRIHAERLVTGGVFALCRNPMYTGNVLMVLGFFLLTGNPAGVVVGALMGGFVYRAIIAAEEGFLVRQFGEAYLDYCRGVPRWIPAPVALLQVAAGHRFDWAAVVVREYGTLFTTVLIAGALVAVRALEADRLAAMAPALIAVGLLAAAGWAVARFLKKSRRLQPGRKRASRT